ncbi:ead/Ea22-like family protein [Pseudomonas sp. PARCl1]|uniref:ead/Ea22-like family protein n=1 Tax=Pseudomonas sp. PARCl1 TaxID=2853444 RepID=UPI00248DCBE9|nr:ead/Ea22-like family protein [Pseudomonas sp. PARCl1]
MTIDKEKLKALAEASGSDEWYAAGDLRYCDDKTGETHGLHHDDGRFIAAASPAAILALLAEIERLTKFEDWFVRLDQVEQSLAASFKAERDQLKAENEDYKSGQERYEQIIEDLKAEIEALRKALGEISGQVDGNIRCAVRDVVNCRGDVQDIYGYCDNIDEIIEAAMAKEKSHD